MDKKTCFKCQQFKPLSEFYKHAKMADGHLNKCKECTKKDAAQWYDNTFEQRREYERKRFQQPERKAKLAEYQKKRRQADPKKERNRQKTTRAIRTGKLVRQPCVKCGNPKSQAHHHDYSKPLDVTWLCFVCHRLEHGHTNVTR